MYVTELKTYSPLHADRWRLTPQLVEAKEAAEFANHIKAFDLDLEFKEISVDIVEDDQAIVLILLDKLINNKSSFILQYTNSKGTITGAVRFEGCKVKCSNLSFSYDAGSEMIPRQFNINYEKMSRVSIESYTECGSEPEPIAKKPTLSMYEQVLEYFKRLDSIKMSLNTWFGFSDRRRPVLLIDNAKLFEECQDVCSQHYTFEVMSAGEQIILENGLRLVWLDRSAPMTSYDMVVKSQPKLAGAFLTRKMKIKYAADLKDLIETGISKVVESVEDDPQREWIKPVAIVHNACVYPKIEENPTVTTHTGEPVYTYKDSDVELRQTVDAVCIQLTESKEDIVIDFSKYGLNLTPRDVTAVQTYRKGKIVLVSRLDGEASNSLTVSTIEPVDSVILYVTGA